MKSLAFHANGFTCPKMLMMIQQDGQRVLPSRPIVPKHIEDIRSRQWALERKGAGKNLKSKRILGECLRLLSFRRSSTVGEFAEARLKGQMYQQNVTMPPDPKRGGTPSR
ncbi:hypothetical protein [Rhizobium subbaraonis]|uniref:hypothetical protein n=1 Tax=Rhizobium subbaraonis TaxID=908946 RepID=UPI0011439BE9|nr:hypothetical protein [Rhizobium subbaraonis]